MNQFWIGRCRLSGFPLPRKMVGMGWSLRRSKIRLSTSYFYQRYYSAVLQGFAFIHNEDRIFRSSFLFLIFHLPTWLTTPLRFLQAFVKNFVDFAVVFADDFLSNRHAQLANTVQSLHASLCRIYGGNWYVHHALCDKELSCTVLLFVCIS